MHDFALIEIVVIRCHFNNNCILMIMILMNKVVRHICVLCLIVRVVIHQMAIYGYEFCSKKVHKRDVLIYMKVNYRIANLTDQEMYMLQIEMSLIMCLAYIKTDIYYNHNKVREINVRRKCKLI